jgi:uncharacterized delta-60 repeat protein
MRDDEMVRRGRAGVLTVVTLAVIGVLLLMFASAAVAVTRPIGPRTTSWSVSRILQGTGQDVLGHDTTRATDFLKRFDIGRQGFVLGAPNLSENADPQVRSGPSQWEVLARAPSLDRIHPLASPKGSVAHLRTLRVFEKDGRDAFLHVTLGEVLLETVDANGPLSQFECPVVGTAPCPSLHSDVHVRVLAWRLADRRHPLLNVGGTVSLEGHEGAWLPTAATDAGSRGAFWEGARFAKVLDLDDNGTQQHAKLFSGVETPITLEVPLRSLTHGDQFAVEITLDATAIDERGGESAAQAFVLGNEIFRSGGHAASILSAHGLKALRVPNLKEPPMLPQPSARCAAGPRPRAGAVQFSAPAFSAGEASGTPMVLVTRQGGSRGATSVTVTTSGGSAQSGVDFKPTRTVVRFENGDTSPRLVEIPIREDLAAESPESFKVSLAHVRCSRLGKQRSASVTILDDDQPPPPPPPAFTIAGTVDGLQGSGLVLSNLGAEVPVSANGSFTFPGTASDGQPYQVGVKTEPHNPDQLCTVQNGTGHVASANVTDIAVHCAAQVIPSGLDSTFGDGGRVTTAGTGDGRAVLIQPDGGIVTVGPREVGVSFHFQFGATRHDEAGHLDPSFGTGGIATTSLGGNDDKALDAVLLPGGAFVAVGQADPAGLANTDFGVVRYTPDGHPDPAFNTTGIETTDVSGRDDVAHAVAVQPDGKIVATGEAETSPGLFDFALVRYNPDGTLDTSFGGDGIVTTDFGTNDDAANGIAIQSDGRIVAVGVAGENIALARYLPDGELDRTFGGTGTVVSDLGFDDVANGVAITPGGTILIAGTRLGPHTNLDPIVASFGPNGRLNLGFGDFGVADTDLSGGDDSGDDLALEANGDIVLVGTASSATVSDMALVRFKPDGTLDTSMTADFQGTGDFGHALAIDHQGRIVAAGSSGAVRAHARLPLNPQPAPRRQLRSHQASR